MSLKLEHVMQLKLKFEQRVDCCLIPGDVVCDKNDLENTYGIVIATDKLEDVWVLWSTGLTQNQRDYQESIDNLVEKLKTFQLCMDRNFEVLRAKFPL